MTDPHCKHHSRSDEWSALSFEQRATIAQTHFRAGLRQVTCECGEFVWHWELVHDPLVPSGFRWVCVDADGSAWLLKLYGTSVGDVHDDRYGNCCAVAYRRQGPSGVVVHWGETLEACARVLVKECGRC